jgi:drug/metabolite transporter (DMT)-like permease
MYVVSKLVLEVIPPFALITLRLLLGALVLGCILGWRGWPGFTSQQILRILAVGFIGYGVSLGFQFVGTQLSTAANGALITAATPGFVLLFAAILLRERVTARRILALLVSTVGVLAVVNPLDNGANPKLLLGNLSLLAAALTWALYSVLVRKIRSTASMLPLSAVALLGGLPVSFPMGLWELSSQAVGPLSWQVITGVLFLGIVATAGAMYLWNTAFALLDASVASLTFFAQPLVGTTLGVILLGESISPVFVLGAGLIGSGLLLASREG